jgi:GDP-D-mannose 3',5'-epimerase
MVSMIEMAHAALRAAGKDLKLRHIPGPEGVRGRNSNNDLIRQILGWSPQISLEEGLKRTVVWIREQIEAEKASGVDVTQYSSSKVVGLRNPSDVFKA